MSGAESFYGSSRTGGSKDPRVAGVVAALIVAFLGLAVAKPWGAPPEPAAPSVGPSATSLSPASPSIQAERIQAPAARSAVSVGPLPVAFTTPAPLPAGANWTGLRWRRLSPDDPFGLVTSVVPWHGGFVAIGSEAGLTPTPMWTSIDGAHWDPLALVAPTRFWPGLAILGIGDLSGGLVAVTETREWCDAPCASTYVLPVVAWTSSDGRTWTEHALPPEWLASPSGSGPLFAFGPGGAVIGMSRSGTDLIVSTDGSGWHLLSAGAFPGRFVPDVLLGTPAGYVAAGRWQASDTSSEAATLWSPDGRHWSPSPAPLLGSPEVAAGADSAVASLVRGRGGLVAIGGAPGAGTLWWQSRDGRSWRVLATFPPLGPTDCQGERCVLEPDGTLLGDGRRLVAIRGGSDAAAWVSFDGLSWRRLAMSGDLPSDRATRATLLPGGVLLSDGSTTWFGQALVP